MKLHPRTFELAALLALALTVLCAVAGFDAHSRDLENEVFRLHVIADSDDAEAQTLKLAVRDAVLKKSAPLFAACDTKAQTVAVACAHLGDFQTAAETALRRAGCDSPVFVTVERTAFPTRTYAGVTLPAGTYDALRVVIGSGQGRNWWCVLFPQLCLPAAEPARKLPDVLSPGALDTALQDPQYEPRFWIVEKLRALID